MDEEKCMHKLDTCLKFIAENGISDKKKKCREVLLDIRQMYYDSGGKFRERIATKLAERNFAG